MVLSNWLNSVKSNNMNLYESMKGGNKPEDDPIRNNNIDFNNLNDSMGDMGRLSPQMQEQQSMLCLLQQINLYRELLAQVTYQNQILGRNVGQSQGSTRSDEMPQNMHNQQRNNYEYRNNFQSRDSESREPKEEGK